MNRGIPPGEDEAVLDLRAYVHAVGKHRRLVASAMVVALALSALVLLLLPKIYTAAARVAVEPPSDRNDVERVLLGSTSVATQAEIASSTPVVRQALKMQGLPHDLKSVETFIDEQLEVQVIFETTVLVIAVESPSPEVAAELAQAVARAYVQQTDEELQTRIRQINEEIDVAAEAAEAEVRALEQQLDRDADSTRESLEQARDDAQAALRSLATRRAELETVRLYSRRARIVQDAAVPLKPTSPKPALTLVFGLLSGAAAGSALAMRREFFGSAVRDEASLLIAGGGPVLGRVALGPQEPALLLAPESEVSAKYRDLRARLLAACNPSPGGARIVAVLPVGSGADAGLFSANLALVLAGAGVRTSLVDADSERGVASSVLAPLLSAPASSATPERSTLLSRVRLVSDRQIQDLGPERVASPNFKQLFAEGADLVVVVAPASDGRGRLDVVRAAHDVLLYVEQGGATRRDVGAAKEVAEAMRVHFLGAVLFSGGRNAAAL